MRGTVGGAAGREFIFKTKLGELLMWREEARTPKIDGRDDIVSVLKDILRPVTQPDDAEVQPTWDNVKLAQ